MALRLSREATKIVCITIITTGCSQIAPHAGYPRGQSECLLLKPQPGSEK